MASLTLVETCLKCDPTCDCCDGPGPKNCNKCASANGDTGRTSDCKNVSSAGYRTGSSGRSEMSWKTVFIIFAAVVFLAFACLFAVLRLCRSYCTKIKGKIQISRCHRSEKNGMKFKRNRIPSSVDYHNNFYGEERDDAQDAHTVTHVQRQNVGKFRLHDEVHNHYSVDGSSLVVLNRFTRSSASVCSYTTKAAKSCNLEINGGHKTARADETDRKVNGPGVSSDTKQENPLRNTASCQRDTPPVTSSGASEPNNNKSNTDREKLPSKDPELEYSVTCSSATWIPPKTVKSRISDSDSFNRRGSSPASRCVSECSVATSGYVSELYDPTSSRASLSSAKQPTEQNKKEDRETVLPLTADRYTIPDLTKAMSDYVKSPNLLDNYFMSSSTQTVNQDNVPTPLVSGSWQFSEVISSYGGVVQKPSSDVRLEIPEGAIDKGEHVTVHKAVNTELHTASTKLKLPEDEVIASPVVELFAGLDFSFKKPVRIVLPHLLPSTSTKNKIRVYQFYCNQDGQVQRLTLQLNGSATEHKSGTYCFEQGNKVSIFVDHFSGVVCTKCKSDCSPPDLYLDLYARYRQESEKEWDMELQLEIWDNDIQDFRKDGAHRDSLNCDQMIMVDSKKLPALMVTDDGPKTNDSSLLVRMEIDPRDSQEWTHRTRDGGRHVFPPKEVYDLKLFLLCGEHRSHRPVRKDWWLTKKSDAIGSDEFRCFVDVGYVMKVDEEDDVNSDFIKSPKEITFKVSVPPGTRDQRAGNTESCFTERKGLSGSNENGALASAIVSGPLPVQKTEDTLIKSAQTDARHSSMATARQEEQNVNVTIKNAGSVSISGMHTTGVDKNRSNNPNDASERSSTLQASPRDSCGSTEVSASGSVACRQTASSRAQEITTVAFPVQSSQEPGRVYSTEV